MMNQALIVGMLATFASTCLVVNVRYHLQRRCRWVVRRPAGPVLDFLRVDHLGDAVAQLHHVSAASFYKKKVMSKAEYRVFRIVENEIAARQNGCRVLAQTSLGEIIGLKDALAFKSINSKRVDVLVIGPYGEPLLAVEYQGGAHFQGDAAFRDAVKKEALGKAGVDLVEIGAATPPSRSDSSLKPRSTDRICRARASLA